MNRLIVLLLTTVLSVNLAAQTIEEGNFAVITFKHKFLWKTETYYWIVPQSSISAEDNGRFCIYPLYIPYLSSDVEPTWSTIGNGNGDSDYCQTDSFCKVVDDNCELVQTVSSKRIRIIDLAKTKERRYKDSVSIYLTFVSGRFMTGILRTDNVINRGYPIKAYAPASDIKAIKMESDDRDYLMAKTTDYQGIAFSITSLASYPLDRELSKAYQEPYQ